MCPTRAFEDYYEPVTESGCWIWMGALDKAGYGGIKVGGKQMGAHRRSWALANGPIPEGMHVLHKCDTPACVNPNHLFLGTNYDNVQDMVRKGRARGGNGKYKASIKLRYRSTLDRLVEIDGEKRSIVGWCRFLGLNYGTVRGRINTLGWPPKKALFTPILAPGKYPRQKSKRSCKLDELTGDRAP